MPELAEIIQIHYLKITVSQSAIPQTSYSCYFIHFHHIEMNGQDILQRFTFYIPLKKSHTGLDQHELIVVRVKTHGCSQCCFCMFSHMLLEVGCWDRSAIGPEELMGNITFSVTLNYFPECWSFSTSFSTSLKVNKPRREQPVFTQSAINLTKWLILMRMRAGIYFLEWNEAGMSQIGRICATDCIRLACPVN